MKNQDNLLYIDSLDQFINIFHLWHGHKVQVLEHMLNVPEGTDMELDDKNIQLIGDVRTAFIEGIKLSLHELGTLPFTVEQEDEQALIDSARNPHGTDALATTARTARQIKHLQTLRLKTPVA